MKAFILIAGEGTRLRPLTEALPKPMLPVVNKPVLQHIIEHLAASGITEIMMNPGYKGEMIEQYFADGSQFGVSIGYLPEMVESEDGYLAMPKGSATTLAFAQYFYQFFDEPVLVLCGDAIIDLDVAAAMAAHAKSSALVSVLLQDIDASQAYKYGIAQVAESGQISEFIEKPKFVSEPRCLANTGVYIFSPQAIDQLPLEQGVDIGGDILQQWTKQKKSIVGLNIPYQWLDIGTIEDFKKVNHLMHRQITRRNDMKGYLSQRECHENKVHTGALCRLQTPISKVRGALYIGNACLVEANVNIVGDVIVGNNTVIGKDSELENCIIGSYCYVPPGTKLVNSILTRDYLITFDSQGNWNKSIRLNSASSRPFFQSVLQAQDWGLTA